MKEVPIPGGTAYLREQGVDPIPGNSVKLIRAAATAMASQFPDHPELFEGARPGETEEQRNARVQKSVEGMTLSTEQAMAWDNLREATAVALLKEWTLDLPLPTLKTIGDLEASLYEALLDAVGGVSSADFETDFGVQPMSAGDTPTDGSASSLTPSAETPVPPSIPTPSTVGAPSTGAVSSPVPS